MPIPQDLEIPHVFAGNPLDRAEVLRRDDDWLASAPTMASARFLPLHKLKVALTDTSTTQELRWFSHQELDAQFAIGTISLLGVDDQSQPHFAAEVTQAPATLSLIHISEPTRPY